MVTATSISSLATATGAPARLYLNDGAAVFTDATSWLVAPSGDDTDSVLLGDLDSDGDSDLIISNVDAPSRILRNDGSGHFTQVVSSSSLFGGRRKLILADLDGDGDLDVLACDERLPASVYKNNGKGQFSVSSPTSFPAGLVCWSPSLCDIDGDGDQDLIAYTGQLTVAGQEILLSNDGTGTFSDVTAVQWPKPIVGLYEIFACGDIDGDGDVDVLSSSDSGVLRQFRNDGKGTFVGAAVATLATMGTHLKLVDIDGDQDLDLLVLDQWRPIKIKINDGSGKYSLSASPRIEMDRAIHTSMVVADFDADGDADLVVGNRHYLEHGAGLNRYYANDGSGTFTSGTVLQLEAAANASGVVSGDLTGDGYPDVIAYDWLGATLYPGSVTGQFGAARNLIRVPPSGSHDELQLGDVDGDGDLDLVFASVIGGARLWLNNGSGKVIDVSIAQLPSIPLGMRHVQLADIDVDGGLDIILAGNSMTVLQNDGLGRYTNVTGSHWPVGITMVTALHALDVDGDGDLDVISGGNTGRRLALNDGRGRFVLAPWSYLPNPLGFMGQMASADVDGDGDLDLAITIDFQVGQRVLRLLSNEGSGRFRDVSASQVPFTPTVPGSLVFRDVDEDGDADLIAVSHLGPSQSLSTGSYLFLNDGLGFFREVTSSDMPRLDLGAVAMTVDDFDGDGDADIVFLTQRESGSEHSLRVNSNVNRQVYTPSLPQLGRALEIQFVAHSFTPSVAQLALPVASLALAAQPVSLGTLGTVYIDLATAVALAPVSMSRSVVSEGELSLPIPNLVALNGMTIYIQALVSQGSGQLSLTNVAAPRIVR